MPWLQLEGLCLVMGGSEPQTKKWLNYQHLAYVW
jgi:hypothetical protein